jgi:hypothetical protein
LKEQNAPRVHFQIESFGMERPGGVQLGSSDFSRNSHFKKLILLGFLVINLQKMARLAPCIFLPTNPKTLLHFRIYSYQYTYTCARRQLLFSPAKTSMKDVPRLEPTYEEVLHERHALASHAMPKLLQGRMPTQYCE